MFIYYIQNTLRHSCIHLYSIHVYLLYTIQLRHSCIHRYPILFNFFPSLSWRPARQSYSLHFELHYLDPITSWKNNNNMQHLVDIYIYISSWSRQLVLSRLSLLQLMIVMTLVVLQNDRFYEEFYSMSWIVIPFLSTMFRIRISQHFIHVNVTAVVILHHLWLTAHT